MVLEAVLGTSLAFAVSIYSPLTVVDGGGQSDPTRVPQFLASFRKILPFLFILVSGIFLNINLY